MLKAFLLVVSIGGLATLAACWASYKAHNFRAGPGRPVPQGCKY